VKIITYPASLRISPIDGFSLNKRIGNKQYIIYNVVNNLYLTTMNPDGTQWESNFLFEVTDGDLLGINCEINDSLIYAVIIISTPTTYIYRLLKIDYSGNIVFNSIIGQDNYAFDHFDFAINKIYYEKMDSSAYLYIATSDLDGNSFVGNKINYQFTYYYLQWKRIGNKLVYLYINGLYLYKATSDLDCTNFVYEVAKDSLDQPIRCSSLGGGATDGSYLYITFISVISGTVYKFFVAKYNGLSFSYNEVSYGGDYISNTFCQDGSYYVLGGGYFAEFDTSDLSLISDTTFYDGSSNDIWSSDVCILSDGNIYVWIKFGVNDVLELWTYPGDVPIPIPLPLPSPHPWPMIGQNYKSTFSSNYQLYSKITEKWNTQLDDSVIFLLISENSILYAGLYNGKVVSLNIDGSINWTYETNIPSLRIPVSAGILGSDNNLYIASDDGNVIALDINGNLIWKTLLYANSHIGNAITDNNGTLYFLSIRGLYALDYDGNIKWIFNKFASGNILLDNNGNIYVNTFEEFYILNYDGSIKWNSINPLVITSNISISPNGNICFIQRINGISYLIVLSSIDYSELWRYLLINDGMSYNIAIDHNSYVYFTYKDSLGTGFIIINDVGIELFNSRQLNNSISYEESTRIVLDANGILYIDGYDSNLKSIITYNLYTNIYNNNITNNTNNVNGFSIDNGNSLYVYCYGRIISFKQFIELPQVQCRATQIIVSARTGNIILPVRII